MPQEPLDWLEPVKREFHGAGWLDWCVRHYEQVLLTMEEPRRNVLTEREFASACALLDVEPQPTTPAEANQRWCQFVGAVRDALKRHREREKRAEVAQERRKQRLGGKDDAKGQG